MLFVALGLVTFPNTIVIAPPGAAELPVFLRRSLPLVDVFTVQPEASPRLVGCDARVDEALANSKGCGWKHFEPAVMQLDAQLVEAGLDINHCYTEGE